MSISKLEADKRFLENEQQSNARRLRQVNEMLNKKSSNLMDIQCQKRKIEIIDNQELELFVALVKSNGLIAGEIEDSTSDDEGVEGIKIKKTRRT